MPFEDSHGLRRWAVKPLTPRPSAPSDEPVTTVAKILENIALPAPARVIPLVDLFLVPGHSYIIYNPPENRDTGPLLGKIYQINSETSQDQGIYSDSEIKRFFQVVQWLATKDSDQEYLGNWDTRKPRLRSFISTVFGTQNEEITYDFRHYDIRIRTLKPDFVYLLNKAVYLYFARKQNKWKRFGYQFGCCPETGQFGTLLEGEYVSAYPRYDNGRDSTETDSGSDEEGPNSPIGK